MNGTRAQRDDEEEIHKINKKQRRRDERDTKRERLSQRRGRQ